MSESDNDGDSTEVQANPIGTQSSIFVIFGGTGDLSRRKLLPALARLKAQGQLDPQTHILGVARGLEHDDHSFYQLYCDSLARSDISDQEAKQAFPKSHIHFQSIGSGESSDFDVLAQRLEALEKTHQLAGNRSFYLALPTSALPGTAENLARAGLNNRRRAGDRGVRSSTGRSTGRCGWTRVIVEKPFGHDLQSARALNRLLHRYYSEDQIYRIDHYLGKETVQNLLVLRFANAIFESIWNRDRIQAIQITVAEDLGVEARAGYYDKSGALRDMVQNHLTQILSLIAMEVPVAFEAEAIRNEKIKVLRGLAPLRRENIIYGQYRPGVIHGTEVMGYLEEPGVGANSHTETFVAAKVEIDNWRWQGVPFYLRSGKRLPLRTTQIAVRFRAAPVCLFQSMGRCDISSDLLIITLQPNEGFSLNIDVKRPGSPFALQQIPLAFNYQDAFDVVPEAYETLLLDVLQGDQTLFVHADEVENSWQFFDDIVLRPPEIIPYRAGTWGPKEAGRLAIHYPEIADQLAQSINRSELPHSHTRK